MPTNTCLATGFFLILSLKKAIVKTNTLLIILLIVFSLIPLGWIYGRLRIVIRPEISFTRFFAFLLFIFVLIFVYTFLLVLLIRAIFPYS
jgi:hypothetical protein